MIGYLTGTVLKSQENSVLLDVSGVGYKVHVTSGTALGVGMSDKMELFIHTVVREQALDLYGFQTEKELQFFELLLGISGIGPKVGLSILQVALPETLYTAVVNKDSSILTKVSGIGKKNAEKIILELQNKMQGFAGEFTEGGSQQTDLEVFEALEALGFDPRSIQSTLKEYDFAGMETNEKIKKAIKLLGK